MDNFPPEVLGYIFEFLSHADIKNVRLTCKSFYYGTLNYSIMKNDSLTIPYRLFLSKEENIESFNSLVANCSRPFFNCTIKYYSTNHIDCYRLFAKFGSELRQLKLIRCSINEEIFTDILINCKKLVELYIVECDNLLIPGKIFYGNPDSKMLNNLKILGIQESKHVTDSIFCKFMKICPNVENISLKECTINCHQGLYSFFYKSNIQSPIDQPSNCVLTSNCIRDILKVKASQIKALDFSKTNINSVFLSDICQIENLQLTSLNLESCREIKDTGASLLLGEWQPKITELNLSNCDFVCDAIMCQIFLEMSNLEVLKISRCKYISQCLGQIKNLSKLREIDVSYCPQITGTHLINSLLEITNLKIEKINMSDIFLCANDLQRLCKVATLSELHVNNCNKLKNTDTQIVFNQKDLIQFTFAKLQISDFGLVDISIDKHEMLKEIDKIVLKLRQHLRDLNNTFVFNEHDQFYYEVDNLIKKEQFIINSLDNCKRLEILNMNKCRRITDLVFILTMNLNELTQLHASCTKISTIGIYFLAYKCPALELLYLCYTDIDDTAINIISQGLKRLQELYVDGCENLTDLSLEYIGKNCKNLHNLSIRGCNMSIAKIKKMKNEAHLPHILGGPLEKISTIEIPPPPPESVVYNLHN